MGVKEELGWRWFAKRLDVKQLLLKYCALQYVRMGKWIQSRVSAELSALVETDWSAGIVAKLDFVVPYPS